MSIFLDVLVIIIIGVFVVIGFKKGLIKTVVSVIGTFLASALSVFLSNPISEYIYRVAIKTTFIEKVETAMKTAAAAGSGSIFEKLMATFPDFITNSLSNFGISSSLISGAVSNGAEAVETLLAPVIISFISIFVAFLLFMLLMVIIKLISKVVCAAVDDSVIGIVNRFFGGLLGLAEGFIIVILAVFVIHMALPHTKVPPVIFSDEVISDSFIFKGIYDSKILNEIGILSTESPSFTTE